MVDGVFDHMYLVLQPVVYFTSLCLSTVSPCYLSSIVRSLQRYTQDFSIIQ